MEKEERKMKEKPGKQIGHNRKKKKRRNIAKQSKPEESARKRKRKCMRRSAGFGTVGWNTGLDSTQAKLNACEGNRKTKATNDGAREFGTLRDRNFMKYPALALGCRGHHQKWAK